jgi:hypothetical protein
MEHVYAQSRVVVLVESLETAIEVLRELSDAAAQNELPDRIAYSLYAELTHLVGEVKVMQTYIEEAVAHLMGDTAVATKITGEQVVLTKSSSRPRRNWDNEHLIGAVRRLVLNDVSKEQADGAVKALDRMAELYNLSGYNARLGKLREADIDVDEYCETGVTSYRVKVHQQ